VPQVEVDDASRARLLPVAEVAADAVWRRPSLEINLDRRRHRRIELGWRTGPCLRAVDAGPSALTPDRS
jgi:hypothetical protein